MFQSHFCHHGDKNLTVPGPDPLSVTVSFHPPSVMTHHWRWKGFWLYTGAVLPHSPERDALRVTGDWGCQKRLILCHDDRHGRTGRPTWVMDSVEPPTHAHGGFLADILLPFDTVSRKNNWRRKVIFNSIWIEVLISRLLQICWNIGLLEILMILAKNVKQNCLFTENKQK